MQLLKVASALKPFVVADSHARYDVPNCNAKKYKAKQCKAEKCRSKNGKLRNAKLFLLYHAQNFDLF